jgi:hypothetical protein
VHLTGTQVQIDAAQDGFVIDGNVQVLDFEHG